MYQVFNHTGAAISYHSSHNLPDLQPQGAAISYYYLTMYQVFNYMGGGGY